jgi:hypothetical protein
MKKIVLISIVLLAIVPMLLMAQPLPYDPTIGGGTGSTPVGGGAPIGGGLLILLSLAIGYGAKKVFDARQKVLD